MVLALAKEIELRKNEFKDEIVETIYFGGGTPSILQIADLRFLIDEVYRNYKVVENPEITVEANPDDLTENRIIELSKNKVNRLSIGIQSFFEDDLKMMNRAHNADIFARLAQRLAVCLPVPSFDDLWTRKTQPQ